MPKTRATPQPPADKFLSNHHELLTRREAAAFLRVTLDGLDERVHDRRYPLRFLKMGRRFLFKREALIAYCEQAALRHELKPRKRRVREVKLRTQRRDRLPAAK